MIMENKLKCYYNFIFTGKDMKSERNIHRIICNLLTEN